jgi:hypothetical protein
MKADDRAIPAESAVTELDPHDDLSSLRSTRFPLVIFGVGLLVWIGSAGLLFFAALPLMALGACLTVFSVLITTHSSVQARRIAVVIALATIGVTVLSFRW